MRLEEEEELELVKALELFEVLEFAVTLELVSIPLALAYMKALKLLEVSLGQTNWSPSLAQTEVLYPGLKIIFLSEPLGYTLYNRAGWQKS